MTDWRSYDTIAEAYERVWAPRFEMVAHQLLALAPPVEGARLLDLGTGTGAIALAIGDKRMRLRSVVGCDLSRPMLLRAACSWGPSSDPYAAAWQNLLEDIVGDGTIRRAVEQVAPWEHHFSSSENVRTALVDAGFHTARVEVVGLSHDCSAEEYLADRELSSGGRFGRHALGDTAWRGFLERAGAEFRRKFGDRISYERPLLLALATAC